MAEPERKREKEIRQEKNDRSIKGRVGRIEAGDSNIYERMVQIMGGSKAISLEVKTVSLAVE